jgi:pseudaminic acid biosynthesis-associated methylase
MANPTRKKPGRKSRAELEAGAIREWIGDFGNHYQQRNASSWPSIKNRSRMFGDIFQAMENAAKANPALKGFPESVFEAGCGCGDNLRAIDMVYERARATIKLTGCDPNEAARLAAADAGTILPGDLRQLPMDDASADLVFTSGVLIHIPPSDFPRAMAEIHRVSKRWILSIEYFNPTVQEVEYHGEKGLMWRRDYGEEWLAKFPDLKMIGYGFGWKRHSGLDNVTWFLLEKPQA